VAFEIARRHRFLGDLARLPEDVAVHVLPTGQTDPPRYNDLSQLRYRRTSHISDGIARAREATARYLDAAGDD
jgi:NTE family protein